MKALAFDQVTKQFGNKIALNNVSFHMNFGQFTALLGANGAGKSTMFNLIAGLDVPNGGAITIQGSKLGKSARKDIDIRKSIGWVFQETALDQDLSVVQNMRYHAGLYGIKNWREKSDQLLREFELIERAKDRVRNMNGGHKRRLELARALLHDPQILVLDEPTVGLDPISARFITKRAHELCKKGVCVMWITHLLDEIEPSDEVIFLDQGEIKSIGKFRELGGAKGMLDQYRHEQRPAL